MINEELNEYSEIACTHPIFYCGPPTVEATEKALASLDEDSALGPDLVPTRILKRCAKVLSYPAHADFRNLEVLRMANDMEGALGGTSLQTKIGLRPKQL